MEEINLWISRRASDPNLGRYRVWVGEITFREVQEGDLRSPLLSLQPDEAQKLMDSLWGCGVRPRANTSAGQLEQCEKHLADLRVIAFHKLGIKADEVAAIGGRKES